MRARTMTVPALVPLAAAALLGLLGLAGGCAGPAGVEVTVDGSDLAQAPTHLELTLHTDSAEESHRFTLPSGTELPGVIVALLPASLAGSIEVSVIAYDGAERKLGEGSSTVMLEAGERARTRVTLRPTAAPVADPPRIAAVCPMRLATGDRFQVDGRGFQPGARVTVGGRDASVTSDEEGGTRLIARMPDLDPAVGASAPLDVTVVNPDGRTDTLAGAVRGDGLSDLELSDRCYGECTVTISGRGLADDQTVLFGDRPVPVVDRDDDSIQVTAPEGRGTDRVKVCYPEEQCSALGVTRACHDAGNYHY